MLLYRLLISLFAALMLLRARRVDGPGAAAARLFPQDPAAGPHVWLHGASNGELASARPVLERLIKSRPDLNWLVTSNTLTGVALVKSWALPRVSVRPAPLDLARVTRRTFRGWDIRAHITLEAELWPHRILLCPGPVVVLGARMSAATARGWARLAPLARRVTGALDFVSAQDAGSLDRLRGLGLPQTACGPVVDLKAFYAKPALTPDTALQDAFPRDKTWLAASTHPGEEEIVLQAHRALLKQAPEAKLILAPRHPKRSDALHAMIMEQGFSVARRSAGQTPGAAQVYLADTMGEMALWYALAGRVFVAGSLTDRGGHTPYEPAAYGAALIHGPDIQNFRATYARLAEGQAAREIHDADGLAKALADLQDPAQQRAKGQHAQNALTPQTDVQVLCDAVLAHLPRP